jgi:predicted ATPase/class 3 adenylate cyclase/pimeloyl-ACP methyl ester carboxylesterase
MSEPDRPVRVDFRAAGGDRAIVFLHGFLGHAQRTWGSFPDLLMTVEELEPWDLFGIGYSSSLRFDVGQVWRADANLEMLGYYLRTMLAVRPLSEYRSIALVAHSMGGLVAQQALLDPQTRAKVSHLFMFGTPSMGVGKANPFRGANRQARDMATGSAFIKNLRAAWPDVYGEGTAFTLRVVAGERDAFVLPASSIEPFPDDTRFVVPGDHATMIKPVGIESPNVQLVVASLVGARARGSKLPRGTVTLLFSDIEGSTRLWEEDSARMRDALGAHNEILCSTIDAHHGHVFKTVGDSFCAVFADAVDAVTTAIAAQHALSGSEDVGAITVRMAIHSGTLEEEQGDYVGPAVNRVARLLAIGHGGQVLLSRVTTDLVQGTLPTGTTLRDLGEHRLRDLARPEHVYQLLAPDLGTDFPPLRSLQVLPNNLPLQLSTFVGREMETSAIIALIEQHRLVTLVGSGGVGKTRLSLRVAANLLDGSGDGVWFIELAPLRTGEYIPSTVALSLGLTLAPEGDPAENLVRALKTKHTLLVFDNCEHLVEPAARVISAILHGAPKVRVLASSRQGLGVAGEATYQVPSLVLPAKDAAHLSAIELMRYESVALFVERARAASATFSLTDKNAPIVADICRRIDGIPLAIELAAARVKMLSPHQLRERLDERFRVLTGGSRDALPRQQTMRALIDWSHDLLDERERALFRRLGIFVNGFTLEGAVAVGSGGGDLDELDVFDVLASLVDKSLVLAEPHGDALRYGLLESTRAYAVEKLDDAGERDAIADCHLRHLRDSFAALWERRERGAVTADIVAALQSEADDVRSALDRALVRSKVIEGGELLARVARFWGGIGLETEGATRCEAFLAALPGDELRLHAQLSSALASLFFYSGHKVDAFERATQAVEYARASADVSLLAVTLSSYATLAVLLGRLDDAERALAQAEMLGEGSVVHRLTLLEARASLSQFRGDFETAARIFEQLRKEQRTLGNANGELAAAINLAEVEHARGHSQRAAAIVAETLPIVRADGDKSTLDVLLHNLAGYLAAIDDLSGALAAAREAIGIWARNPDRAGVAVAMEHLSLVYALRGELTLAAMLEGYADAALQRYGFMREFTEATSHDRITVLLGKGLAPDELARVSLEGASLTPEAAIALALEKHETNIENKDLSGLAPGIEVKLMLG